MHNCKTIKELLLTDYIDNRLDTSVKSQVDDHLKQCASCQAFAKEVKQHLVVPLEKSTRLDVPEHLWNQIREKIHPEEISNVTAADRIANWFRGFSWPRLMPALGAFAVLVLLVSSVLLNQPVKEVSVEEAGMNLTDMLTLTSVSTQDGNDAGTPIENYFL
jgi:hypothetical protein